jgi:phosphatidylglycerol lysyltransferase
MTRRVVFGLLIIGFVWVVVANFTEVQLLARTFAQGRWQLILAALAVQIIYYIVFTASYQAAFHAVEVQSHLWNLIPVTLGSLFVNVVAPAGGAGGAALFVDDAKRHNQSPARATAGTLLQLIADFSSFTLVLIIGLIYLSTQHDMQPYEILAAFILLGFTVGLSGILMLGLWRPALLQRLLGWLQRSANRLAVHFKHAPLLADDWPDTNAADFISAASAIANHPLRLVRTWSLALAAHFLDITCLYILFMAFNQPILVGPLLAGYAMGVLFWVVSITPQGIGVVEGVMSLVYTSLGVPSGIATTVSLAFRGLTFWLPLTLGFVLLRRVKTFGTGERTLAESWEVRLASLLTAIMGIINVLSAVTPSLMARLVILEQFFPLTIRRGGHLTAALAGFALLLLAGNLWRRKQVAWLLTLVVLVVSAISHMIKGLDYEEALLSVALALWLWQLRHHFHARSDRPSVQQGIRVLISSLAFTLAYGVAGFYFLDHHFSVNFSFWSAVRQTVVMFTQFYDPGLQPITGFGRYFADSIYIIGIGTVGYALFMLVRPVFIRIPATSIERVQAQAIVEAFGHSSLAPFTLFDDKAYFFSPGGSMVAYVAKGRVAIALGDPIGPENDIPASISEFKQFCSQNDWTSAFYQTLPDYLESYKQAGFHIVCIGHAGIVDLATFTLEGGENRGLRYAVNHLAKLGYRAEVINPPISDALLGELRMISDEWLTNMNGSEKRFSVGWFEDDYIRKSRVMVIITPEGQISAFVNILSEYQRNEATIDLMRRRSDIEPGAMEFLFASLFRWAREQGYATFDLGLSSLSGVGEHPGDPSIERILHYVYEHINQFYNFKGLHTFKDKFHPSWSPRYLVYPSTTSLPVIWTAMARADSGEHFVIDYLKDLTEKLSKSG